MSSDHAHQIIDAVRTEVEQAVETVLSGVEAALRDVAAARCGDDGALDRLELSLLMMLEACSVQDITGQRLSKLSALIGAAPLGPSVEDELLNGPAFADQGLDQAAADLLMNSPPPS